MDRCCENCKWHDNFTYACFNGESPNRADFTAVSDYCNKWEHIEMNDEKTQEFLKLVAENPDLPVVPLVDYDVTGDDEAAYYIAKFSKASVDEYILEDDDRACREYRQIFYRSEAEGDLNEIEIVLSAVLGYEKIEDMTDAEMREAFNNLPWIKAILVHIGVPTWEVE